MRTTRLAIRITLPIPFRTDRPPATQQLAESQTTFHPRPAEHASDGLVPVTITSGDRETSDAHGYGVPKRDLIVGLQVAFENRWLRVSRGAAHADEFVKELLDMRLFVSRFGGYERYEGRGQDDLVLATALAWWRLRRSWPAMPGGVGGVSCGSGLKVTCAFFWS